MKERSRQTKLKTNVLEKEKLALWVSYQIRFGCVPTRVGLPETQTSISIYNTELHKTFREQMSDKLLNLSWKYPFFLFYIDGQKHIIRSSSCVWTPIEILCFPQVIWIMLKLSYQPPKSKHHLHNWNQVLCISSLSHFLKAYFTLLARTGR